MSAFETIITIGLAASLLVAIAVGVRLLWLARKTRQAPEIAWGATWVLFGCHAGSEIPIFIAEARELALTIFVFFGVLTGSALIMGCWLVFRRTQPIAQTFAWLVVLGLAGTFIYQLAGPGFVLTAADVNHRDAANLNPLPLWMVRHSASLGLLWTAVESVRHYGMQRKQLTIGLGSELAARRFLLLGTSCTFLLVLVGATYLGAVGAMTDVVEYVVQPIASLVGATFMWLAFFPPSSWRERFAGAAT